MIVTIAVPDDLDALLALEETGFPPAERWGGPSWATELTREDRLVLVSREVGEVEAVACFSVLADTAELLRVIVRPDRRGRRVAGRLLGVGKEWAEAAGASRMLLEVRHDNAAALGLYSASGFEAITRRRDYYGPARDALVMECRLPLRNAFEPRHALELQRWSS